MGKLLGALLMARSRKADFVQVGETDIQRLLIRSQLARFLAFLDISQSNCGLSFRKSDLQASGKFGLIN